MSFTVVDFDEYNDIIKPYESSSQSVIYNLLDFNTFAITSLVNFVYFNIAGLFEAEFNIINAIIDKSFGPNKRAYIKNIESI